MKDLIKKIVNSFLALAFAIGIVAVTYHVTRYDSGRLSASILDGLAPVDVLSAEFVSPKGSAYPVNGVVTINSVFVDLVAPNTDGIVSGSDLEGSFITFDSSPVLPCPAGTVFAGSKIILPDTFSTACKVQIEVSGVKMNPVAADLTIEPVSCSFLKTSILRGYGEGFVNISPADLGTFAVTSTGFDFGSITSSIDLNYPVTTVAGAKTFQIHIGLAPDVSVDPINGIDARAKIVANNADGVYEIKVRSAGTGNEALTALNFAYVFNDLMGSDSPFVAYPNGTNPEIILLQATEMGTHPNNGYVCIVDSVQVGPPCFAGGANGVNEGLGVLTTPLKLDNEVLQGDSAIVFASHSAGEIQWITSHPSILEVTSLSEASQQDKGTADFVDTTINIPPAIETADSTKGTYNIADCDKDYTGDPPVYVSGTETCTVTATIPIDYDISGASYTVNVSIEDEVVPVTVQGGTLSGFLEGSGSYSSSAGVGMPLSGTVTGVVSGSVSGTYSGTVTGQISATVQTTGAMTPGKAAQVKVSDFTAGAFILGAIAKGVLTDVPGTFTSTVKKQSDDVSHVAIMYAKRPGTSILSAMDKQGCIASFEIDVIEKKVVLQMVGRQPGDVLDVSDTVQINAFAGGANNEINEYENITAASGIEWFSSNEEVAKVDGTGLLTALKPGVTNITARYDTGEAEIGTIESVPLSITVNKISGLRVTFDKGTEDKLPALTVDNAHKSVIIAIHNPEAAGQTFVIEGQTVNITLPAGTYSNKISKVNAIVNGAGTGLATTIAALTNSLAQPIVKVTTINGYPGMLILQPLNQSSDTDGDNIQDIDENGIIDIDTTALESNVAILPTYNNAIPLPASETYGLQVIAQYDNGATKLLPPTEFTWVNTPVGYLNQASLDSGLIKLGDKSGTSTVVAKYKNADGSVVNSNYVTITVDSGPVIEFVRRIGSGSVTKGSRITLQTKISDVDTVDDIKSISTSLVYSTYSTYQQINQDSTAIWFSATPFLQEVKVVEQGTTGSTGTTGTGTNGTGTNGTGTGETGTSGTNGTTPTPTPQPLAMQYKTYNIPIEIPTDQNLFDGVYKLILSISDASNHTLNYVFPIRIGQIGKGDVNGDGVTNMVDVILAFQIATGINPSPTPAQLLAANVDGVGGVTLVDVILLFNKVTKKP
ncbi:Ig-like domain-containing protein [Patescibacteria group bacterium]|nr:Ig-like domain-containing protein [Patescibacteria group bacterium]MBU1016498.1 Ig-like domain-containing protein [Patescibacteria group bacterium]MBU1685123.1 Ig-like domain-containing protein [Patescibacteria group bacterium]MBU1938623.1 Ig-like domain-containing protein [Patescibacteria group bacterium]